MQASRRTCSKQDMQFSHHYKKWWSIKETQMSAQAVFLPFSFFSWKLHTLLGMGSAALAVAVPYPGKTSQISRKGQSSTENHKRKHNKKLGVRPDWEESKCRLHGTTSELTPPTPTPLESCGLRVWVTYTWPNDGGSKPMNTFNEHRHLLLGHCFCWGTKPAYTFNEHRHLLLGHCFC